MKPKHSHKVITFNSRKHYFLEFCGQTIKTILLAAVNSIRDNRAGKKDAVDSSIEGRIFTFWSHFQSFPIQSIHI